MVSEASSTVCRCINGCEKAKIFLIGLSMCKNAVVINLKSKYAMLLIYRSSKCKDNNIIIHINC